MRLNPALLIRIALPLLYVASTLLPWAWYDHVQVAMSAEVPGIETWNGVLSVVAALSLLLPSVRKDRRLSFLAVVSVQAGPVLMVLRIAFSESLAFGNFWLLVSWTLASFIAIRTWD